MSDVTDAEEWKILPSDDRYEVSSHGRVAKIEEDGGRFILNQYKSGHKSRHDRYTQVLIGGKKKVVRRLVYEAFVGPVYEEDAVIVRDANYDNIHYTNLEKQPKGKFRRLSGRDRYMDFKAPLQLFHFMDLLQERWECHRDTPDVEDRLALAVWDMEPTPIYHRVQPSEQRLGERVLRPFANKIDILWASIVARALTLPGEVDNLRADDAYFTKAEEFSCSPLARTNEKVLMAQSRTRRLVTSIQQTRSLPAAHVALTSALHGIASKDACNEIVWDLYHYKFPNLGTMGAFTWDYLDPGSAERLAATLGEGRAQDAHRLLPNLMDAGREHHFEYVNWLGLTTHDVVYCVNLFADAQRRMLQFG